MVNELDTESSMLVNGSIIIIISGYVAQYVFLAVKLTQNSKKCSLLYEIQFAATFCLQKRYVDVVRTQLVRMHL